jgi:long-chain fatty acid transport protein
MLRRFIFLLLVLSCCYNCFAGGFQVNLQGQKQAGMGHTGTGLLIDASSIFFNPGSVIFLDSVYSFSVGGSLITPRTVYLEPSPGTYTAEMVHNTGTPFSAYTAFKLKRTNRWSLGLGVYTPFGSRAQWPDDWKGQFLIREIDLKTIFVQPTLSFKITDKLGIGAGFAAAVGEFMLRKGIPVQDSTGAYGEGTLEGKAKGFGYNAGIYYKATDKLSFGISYRSQVSVKVENGTAEFTVPASLAEHFPQNEFSTQIDLPQNISFGAGYAASQKLKLALDIQYVGWSSYDTLRIDFTNNTDKLEDIHSPRMYENSFIFRAGGQYSINDNVNVRLGAYYDMTPVQAGYLTPESPDADRISITTGASFLILERFSIDASLLYIEGMKRTDTNLETQFSGTYKNKTVVGGLGFELMF